MSLPTCTIVDHYLSLIYSIIWTLLLKFMSTLISQSTNITEYLQGALMMRILIATIYWMGLPQWFSGKDSICSAGAAGDPGSIPGSGRPLEEGLVTTPVFLPGGSHGQRSLVGFSPESRRVGHDTATKHGAPQWAVLLCVLHWNYLGILHAETRIHYLNCFFILSPGKY